MEPTATNVAPEPVEPADTPPSDEPTATNVALDPVADLAAFMGKRMAEVGTVALERGATNEEAAEVAVQWMINATEYMTGRTFATDKKLSPEPDGPADTPPSDAATDNDLSPDTSRYVARSAHFPPGAADLSGTCTIWYRSPSTSDTVTSLRESQPKR